MLAKYSIALDENNNKIEIENAELDKTYFCPFCGKKMIVENFKDKGYFFSHPDKCAETWNYDDKTDWHKHWLSLFSDNSNVIVKNNNGTTHFADILINNTVIELQQSSLKFEEFWERNYFFSSLGYKIIWIFDLRKEIEKGYIELNDNSWFSYYKRYIKQPFKGINTETLKAMVFIQTSDIKNDNETKVLHHVYWNDTNFIRFISDEDNILTPLEFKEIVSDKTKDFAFNRILSKYIIDECGNMPFYYPERPKIKEEAIILEPTTLKELWKKTYHPLIAENCISKERAVLNSKNTRIETSKSGKIMGYYLEELDGYKPSSKKHLIKDADKSIWKYAETKDLLSVFDKKFKNRYKCRHTSFLWKRIDQHIDVKSNERYQILDLLDKYRQNYDWIIAKSLIDNEYYYFNYYVYFLWQGIIRIDYCNAFIFNASKKSYLEGICINDYIRRYLINGEWKLIATSKTVRNKTYHSLHRKKIELEYKKYCKNKRNLK